MTKSPKETLSYAWLVVLILTIAYIFSFIDRIILSLLVEPIKRDMHLSDTQLSLLMGLSFALFYTFLGLPIGRWADKASRKWIITWGIITWSIMTALCGLVRNFTQFFIARVGVGVGEAALSPAAYSMISDYFPKEKLASALSVYGMGIYLGSGFAMLIGSLIIHIVGDTKTVEIPFFGEIFSWQLVFFYVGLPGILVALLMSFIKEPTRKGVSSINLNSRTPTSPSLGEVLHYIQKNGKAFLLLSIGYGFYTMTTYAGSSWIPTFLSRTYHWDIKTAAFYYGLVVTFMATLGVICGGLLADYWKKKGVANAKIRVSIVSVICFLPLNILYPLMPTGELALLCLIPTSFFASFMFGSGPAAIQEMMPNQMRATASALFLFILNLIGLGLGPTCVALVTNFIMMDDNLIRYSILLNAIITLSIAGFCFILTLKPFQNSLLHLKDWEEKNLKK